MESVQAAFVVLALEKVDGAACLRSTARSWHVKGIEHMKKRDKLLARACFERSVTFEKLATAVRDVAGCR